MKYREKKFPIHYCDSGECMPLMKTRLNKCDLFASNITTESPYKYELPRGLCRKKAPSNKSIYSCLEVVSHYLALFTSHRLLPVYSRRYKLQVRMRHILC